MSKLSMRKISEILRQRHELKRSYRDIGKSLNISIGTISDYLSRAKAAGLSWPLPTLSEEALYAKLFLPAEQAHSQENSTRLGMGASGATQERGYLAFVMA